MGRCCGPCTGKVSQEEYRQHIDKALDFLSGNYNVILKDLEDKMYKASEEMDFEKAAHFRDLLSDVRSVAQKQKMTDSSMEDKDIIAIASDETETVESHSLVPHTDLDIDYITLEKDGLKRVEHIIIPT
jgi:excinuclease ABC subunit C